MGVSLKIHYRGRKVEVNLPDGADVKIDLTDGDFRTAKRSSNPSKDALSKAGPSGRKLYRWLSSNVGASGIIDVDPLIIEVQMGLMPIALGRILATLEKIGLVEVIHRKKEDRSRIVSYKIRVLDAGTPVKLDDESNLYEEMIGDIRESCGKVSSNLFMALCEMAERGDGIVTELSLRKVVEEMRPMPSKLPLKELHGLEKGDWISISEVEPLCLTVLSWNMLRDHVCV